MSIATILSAAKVAVDVFNWNARFQEWRKQRAAEKAAKLGICIIAMFLFVQATCIGDLAEYCKQFPERCGGVPRPTPTATATSSPTPTATETASPSPSPSPTMSPAPTPVPTTSPTPPTTAVLPPTLIRFKVQNIDHTSTPEMCGCANPCTATKFLNDHLCEPGSTPLFGANANTPPGPDGPCDPGHAATFNSLCGKREWLVQPRISVEGAASWVRSDENPFQTFVTFIPGQCFTICTWADDGDKTIDDGIAVPAQAGNKTCAKHCY